MTPSENETPWSANDPPMHPCPRVLIAAYVFIILLLAAAAGFFLFAGIVVRRDPAALFIAAIFGVPALGVARSLVRFWRVWRATLRDGDSEMM